MHIVCGSRVYHITPSPAVQCPTGESCLTLSVLAASMSTYFHSNMTLVFLEGSHTLDSELSISDSTFLKVSSNHPNSTDITCESSASLSFVNITRVQIDNLHFVRCHGLVQSVKHFILEDTSFYGADSTAIGYSALELVNTNGSITRSCFTSNTMGSYKTSLVQPSVSARVGGALTMTEGNVFVEGSHFVDNSAEYGGAIFLERHSNMTIQNSLFVNNSVVLGSTDTHCYGGALFADIACTIIIRSTTFMNNTSEYGGGALVLFKATYRGTQNMFKYNKAGGNGGGMYVLNGSKITANGSHYDSNKADTSGGAVFAHKYANIAFHSSFFDSNTAGNDVGALYATFGSNITVDNCAFDRNEAGNNVGVLGAYNNSIISIKNCSFECNTALNIGVMYAYGNSTITLQKSLFVNNEVSGVVSASLARYNSFITVESSFFDSNVAGSDAGVFSAQDFSVISVLVCRFNANIAGGDGGALYALDHSNLIAYSSLFLNNEAGDVGGAIYVRSDSNLVVENSHFHGNLAEYASGSIAGVFTSSITVTNSSFSNSKGGVIIAILNCIMSVKNSTFTNNSASDAGVLYAQRSSTIAVESSFFEDNFSEYDGGVLVAYIESSISVNNSSFSNNVALNSGGVAYAIQSSSIIVNNSLFSSNTAGTNGGVAFAFDRSSIVKNGCVFVKNTAQEGGVIAIHSSVFKDLNGTYSNNTAGGNGGAITSTGSDVHVIDSKFINNVAGHSGGVLSIQIHERKVNVTLELSMFQNNKAHDGGVIAVLDQAFLKVMENIFVNNNAQQGGGVLYLQKGINSNIRNAIFSNNSVNGDGGVIFSAEENYVRISNSTLKFNQAQINGGAFYLTSQSELTVTGDTTAFFGNVAHNGGAIFASTDSRVNIHSQVLQMVSNVATNMGGALFLSTSLLSFESGKNTIARNRGEHGGAIFATQSRIDIRNHSTSIGDNIALQNGGGVHLSECFLVLFSGINKINRNHATNGGAIYASQSEIIVETKSLLTEAEFNSAAGSGGAMYLNMSRFEVRKNTMYIIGNTAIETGGGLHAVNSTTLIEGVLQCNNNSARNGGGFGLERSSKMFGVSPTNDSISFVSNRASHHGGAIYVNDETNSDMCATDPARNATWTTDCFLDSLFINALDNSAGLLGSNLFGGLLDRCTVHSELHLATTDDTIPAGLDKLLKLSDIGLDTISSHPVQMCFCRDGRPSCYYQPESIQIEREMTLSIQLVAYDQVNSVVDATIDAFTNSSAGGLGEGQGTQLVGGICAGLNFNFFSPNSLEVLTMTTRGPCNDTELSTKSINIEIKCTCPIGFEISDGDEEECLCVCDSVLKPYDKTVCNRTTKSIIRGDQFWITYINHTELTGYLIHPHCPFDYCHSPEQQVSVNLNLPDGSNAQCASHRSGTLCGSCEPGYSVSLGSSRCLRCPTHWPGLLTAIIIIFILSGIGLVVFLLVLNLTVAMGTLNAIILYANIMAAAKSVFFSSSELSFASVFISWLNLDLGVDTCFFDGMDTYVKTWLQLAFPAYIIFIVVLMIQLSHYFDTFGRLVGKKDPVATLAMLILLSYTKLLQTIISTFSYATLNYPNGLRKFVWLSDASIGYFTFQHGALLVTAIVILLVGLIFTFLLFLWQWLLCCPRKRVKFIKFVSFMEIYHVPYHSSHRYWTGLMLLVRVSIYLVTAFNPSGDPKVSLLSISFIMSCILVYVAVFNISLYRNPFIKAIEVFTYFNIYTLSIFSWYSIDFSLNQKIVTNISVGLTFVQLLGVILYHVYKYTNRELFTRLENTPLFQKIRAGMTKRLRTMQEECQNTQPSTNNDIHQIYQLVDSRDLLTTSTISNIDRSTITSDSIVETSKQNYDNDNISTTAASALSKRDSGSTIELEKQKNDSDIDITEGETKMSIEGGSNDDMKELIPPEILIESFADECDDPSVIVYREEAPELN